MQERPEEQPKFVNLTSEYKGWSPEAPEGLARLRDWKPSGIDSDFLDFVKRVPRDKNGKAIGPPRPAGAITGGLRNRDEVPDSQLDVDAENQWKDTAGILKPAAPTKTPQPFKLPGGYDPSKKKNAGGLSAARQHAVPDFFPGQLDQLKLGPMRVQPIAFMGASPQINLRTVAFQGFLKNQS